MIATLRMLRPQKPDEEISTFDTYDRFTPDGSIWCSFTHAAHSGRDKSKLNRFILYSLSKYSATASLLINIRQYEASL
jgi:hypothetical protein